jgi:hypothetical protein
MKLEEIARTLESHNQASKQNHAKPNEERGSSAKFGNGIGIKAARSCGQPSMFH